MGNPFGKPLSSPARAAAPIEDTWPACVLAPAAQLLHPARQQQLVPDTADTPRPP